MEKKAFEEYVSASFPEDKKRNRSALVHRKLRDRIVSFLKGSFAEEADKAFRHYVKKKGFKLIDFPEAGIRDALVVPIEENKQVYSSYCSLSY